MLATGVGVYLRLCTELVLRVGASGFKVSLSSMIIYRFSILLHGLYRVLPGFHGWKPYPTEGGVEVDQEVEV